MPDPLAPFDEGLVATVAEDHGLAPATLRTLVERHHDHAARIPGIDELVVEWRQMLPYDPLVARTPAAYHLAVAPAIWEEFGTQIGLAEAELTALRALHAAQARRSAAARGDELEVAARAPMVLAR